MIKFLQLRNSFQESAKMDNGITLIEVMIATLITSLLSIVLYKTTWNASLALTKTSQEVISNFQIIHFASDLRYNVASSSDVFVFANTPLPNSGNICSSWNKNNVEWSPLTSNSKIVRPLFSVRVKDLIYDRADPNPPIYTDSTTRWYGYELRSDYFPGKININLEIWRVSCDGISPIRDVNQDRKMLTLGEIPGQVSSLPNGSAMILCAANSSEVPCTIDSSTIASAYYVLKIPYIINSGKNRGSIKLFQDDKTLQILKRRLQVNQ